MDVAPDDMFYPLGVVVQYADGNVRPVFEPECRHDVQCVLQCNSKKAWPLFVRKLKLVLVPKSKKYILTVHSLAMCDIELVRGEVTPKGVQTWDAHYTFL